MKGSAAILLLSCSFVFVLLHFVCFVVADLPHHPDLETQPLDGIPLDLADMKRQRHQHHPTADEYWTHHGHKLSKHEVHQHDCHTYADKVCLPHKVGHRFAEHVIMSRFARCLQRKRSEMPRKCHHFVDSFKPCLEDIESFCPMLNAADTHECMDKNWEKLSPTCRSSKWYRHQFKHDHARVTKPRHHHEEDHPHHPVNHRGWTTPHDVHESPSHHTDHFEVDEEELREVYGDLWDDGSSSSSASASKSQGVDGVPAAEVGIEPPEKDL